MKKYLSLFVFLLPLYLAAQVVRTHTDGSKIIVNPDGTAVYFNDRTPVADYQGGEGGGSYPIVSAKIEPLSGNLSVTENDLRRIADRKVELARQAARLAKVRAEAATENRIRIEARLGSSASTDANAQRQLKLARDIEAESLTELNRARNKLQVAETVVSQNRYVEAYNEARRRRRARADRGAQRAEQLPQARRLLATPANDFTGYGSPVTQNRHLPYAPCRLAFDGPDENDRQHLRITQPELFFTHTDESLRPYLEGKEYLTATAYVHGKAGYRYLTLRIVFANPNAIQTYGYLPKGSILSVHLLDGNYLNLRSGDDANGSWDDVRKELSYTVTYPIDRSMISSLRQSELDYVQLFWSSGFEEYEIYQVDVLRRLFECI